MHSTLPAQHLKTTAKVVEGELYFASCSFCCYKDVSCFGPPQQGSSDMCCQSLNPPPHHPFPRWRWKKANDAHFCKWKCLFGQSHHGDTHSSQKVLLHLKLTAKQPRTCISTLLSKKLDIFFFLMTQKEQASPDLRGQSLSWCELVKLLQYN